jgi:hypothetical protein
MGLLVALHRWWGVAFCLLFAMWFASGIVMHFVPFPARSEAGRVGGSDAGGDRGIHSEQGALRIAAAHARSRGLDPSRATVASIGHDQWTVAGNFDSDRPLYRIAVNDAAGSEIYVSSAKATLSSSPHEACGWQITSAASRTGSIRPCCAVTAKRGAR